MKLLNKRQCQDVLRDLLNVVYKYEDENVWFEVSVWESGTIVETHPTRGYSTMMALDLQIYDTTEEIIKEVSSFAKWYQQENSK